MIRRVDIIGAGISGLATAYYLARSTTDLEIRVWEKDEQPGGLAGSFSTERFSVEKFYHHLFKRDTALQQLIADLDLGPELVWRPASTGAYYMQRPYRLSSPLDLLRFKPLSLVDRLRLGWLAVHARTVKHWEQLDDISARDYIIRTAGPKVYEVVWEPLLHGKFGPHAESVSAAWLWRKLVDRGGSRDSKGQELLGYVRGGLGRVFDAIVREMRERGHAVHLGTRVRCFEGGPRGIERLVTDRGTFDTDVVVGAAQTPQLADLLPESVPQYRDSLRRVQFLANVCLVLTLERSLSDFYWTNVTDPEAPFIGIVEQTRWADRQDYGGTHLAYVSAYVPGDDPRLSMDAADLLQAYLPHVRRLFPDFDPGVVADMQVWSAPYAQPVVEVGYRHVVPEVQSPIENLLVCTMAQIYPNDRQVSNGVEMARKTVATIRSKIEAARG